MFDIRALGIDEIASRFPQPFHQAFSQPESVTSLFPAGGPASGVDGVTATARSLDPGLVEAWSDYLDDLGAPEAVRSNFQALSRGEAVAVVTGQQPGVLGGPLYTLYKSATIVHLAKALTDAGIPAVPVFWNHSDDHDWAEVRGWRYVDAQNQLQTLQVDVEPNGRPLHTYDIGNELEAFVEAWAETLVDNDFKAGILEQVSSTLDPSPSRWFSRLLLARFGHHGLVPFEPHLGAAASGAFLRRAISEAGALRGAAERGIQGCSEAGWKVTWTADEVMTLFIDDGERRTGLREEGGRWVGRTGQSYTPEELLGHLDSCDGCLSPGAALRPLQQDLLLNTAITVGGPSELTYLGQLAPLYDAIDLSMPRILPRAGMTLLEPRIEKVLTKFDLEVGAVLSDPPEPGDVIDEDLPEPQRAIVTAAQESIRNAISELQGALLEIDGGLRPFVEKQGGRVDQTIDGMLAKAKKSHRRLQDVGRDQIAKILVNLLPAGGLQERTLSVYSFENRYGPELSDALIDAARPETVPHAIASIRP